MNRFPALSGVTAAFDAEVERRRKECCSMSMDYSKYPRDWKAISLRIRERDGWKCKWCGLANGAVGCRGADGRFYEATGDGWDENVLEAIVDSKLIKIVLTVAHIDHTTTNNSDDNLAALCQRCHQRHDIEQHVRNAAETRRRKRIAAGQAELLEAQS